ncbi:metal ABC transporter substrate-binding protein [Exiguobacterium mexicanum]|uniref:metal ABC transporter substrate-binding protein n=1 Tax=Exiguobacterium mexicanum TaxID=340146 RepID=UPI0037C04A95
MNKKLLGVAAAGTLLLGGCASNEESGATEETSDQLTVYASTFALKSFAEEIGGDRVRVEMVIPPGADPHTYEPTSKQMTDIAEADLFLTVGHDLEPYVESMEKSLANENVTFVKTAEDVTLLRPKIRFTSTVKTSTDMRKMSTGMKKTSMPRKKLVIAKMTGITTANTIPTSGSTQ